MSEGELYKFYQANEIDVKRLTMAKPVTYQVICNI